jgi:hypothetical protein
MARSKQAGLGIKEDVVEPDIQRSILTKNDVVVDVHVSSPLAVVGISASLKSRFDLGVALWR